MVCVCVCVCVCVVCVGEGGRVAWQCGGRVEGGQNCDIEVYPPRLAASRVQVRELPRLRARRTLDLSLAAFAHGVEPFPVFGGLRWKRRERGTRRK